MNAFKTIKKRAIKKALFKAAVITITALIVFLCTSVAYAAFINTRSLLGNINVNIGNTNVVNVASEPELVAQTRGSEFNTVSKTSVKDDRKVITLTSDILLTQELNITRDCHLNLNGHKINLNGFAINVKHTYSGTFIIANGILESTAAAVLNIKTPNAIVKTDTLTLSNVSVNTQALNADLLFNDAFNIITNVVADNMYSGNPFTLGQQVFDLPVNIICPLHTDGGCSCSVVFSDISLPFNYFDYDVVISYSSSDKTVLSDFGKVNTASVFGYKPVTLTAKIEYNGLVRTKNYDIVIINPNDNANMAKMGVNSLAKSFLKYKNSDGVYALGGSVLLPLSANTYGTSYTYSVLDSNKAILSSSAAHFDTSVTGAVVFSPSSDSKFIRITGTRTGQNYSIDLPVTGQGGSSIKDNYTVANSIISELFGGTIWVEKDINNLSSPNNGYSIKYLPYTSSQEPKLEKYFRLEELQSIAYSDTLINNLYNTYTVSPNDASNKGKLLHVTDNLPNDTNYLPNTSQNIFVKVTFTFIKNGVTEVFSLNIPVKYTISGGDNTDPFDPYYTYFDRIVQLRTGGSTYGSFELPSQYGDGAPYVEYYVDASFQNRISITFDSANKKYVFTVNKSALTSDDLTLSIKYKYSFTTRNEMRAYSGNVSKINIPGVIKNDSTGIADFNLYKSLYEKLYTAQTYTSSDIVNKFLLSSTVKTTTTLDLSNIKTVGSYKGIELFTNLTSLNLKNSSLDSANSSLTNKGMSAVITELGYVAKLSKLKTLDLSYNNLTDSESSFFNFPTQDNHFIRTLSTLKALELLRLDKNLIYRFADLSYLLPSLNTVYVMNNRSSLSLYGSKGSVNINTYISLLDQTNNTILIYNDGDAPYSKQSDPNYYSRYLKISSIEFQERLPVGVPINRVWENLSTVITDYALTDTVINTYSGVIFPGSINGTYTPNIRFEAYIPEGSGLTAENTTVFKVIYTYYTGAETFIFDKTKYRSVNTLTVEVAYTIERIG